MKDLLTYFAQDFSGARLTVSQASVELGGKALFASVSFMVESGELLWVSGDNGSGKTTLLRVCAGLLRPDAGAASWRRAHRVSSSEDCLIYQSDKGYAKAGLTLKEDYKFWSSIYGAAADMDVLEALGLSGALSTQTQYLSAGQRRRLSLAKLTIQDKPIWVMDEPMTGLDAAGRGFVQAMIAAHLTRGGLAIIASHNPIKIGGDHTVRRLTLEPQIMEAGA